MDDRTRSIAIAVVAILAVAVVAATIDSTVVHESTGSGPGPGEGGPGEGISPPPAPETAPGESIHIPYLSQILTILAALAALVLVAYAYRHWRTTVAVAVAIVAAVVVTYLLVSSLGSTPELPVEPPSMGENGSLLPGGGGGDGGEADQPSLPAVLLVLVLGGALVATLVAYVRSGSAKRHTPSESGDDEGDVDAAAVGAAAGRAADRLEEASDVENEVYRAWREMTELLEVADRETTTPAEFEAAAVEAGLGREDVRELTRLFEDVRYGGREASTDRERRAVDVFRRIEAQYTEEGS